MDSTEKNESISSDLVHNFDEIQGPANPVTYESFDEFSDGHDQPNRINQLNQTNSKLKFKKLDGSVDYKTISTVIIGAHPID